MSEDRWKTTIDEVSPPLHIEERPARDHDLYLRWGSDDDRHRPKLENISSVRDEDGDIDPDLVTRARSQALKQYRAEKNDQEKPSGSDPGGSSRSGSETPLDLQAGFDKVLAVPGGKYPQENENHADMRRARNRVLEILGAGTRVENLRPSDYRSIWRTFAREYDDRELGWRMAESTVSDLYAAVNWLHEEGHIDRAPSPPTRWRSKLKTEWEEITGREAKPDTPRHSTEEYWAFFENIDEADPRLQLCLQLGAEYRLGQVVRTDRSNLDLSEGAGIGHGQFRIPGKPKKPGALVYLTPEMRETVDHALERGHLAAYEEL